MPVAYMGVRYIKDERIKNQGGKQQPCPRDFFTNCAHAAPKAEQGHHEQKSCPHDHVGRMNPGIIRRTAPEVGNAFEAYRDERSRMTSYELQRQPALGGDIS